MKILADIAHTVSLKGYEVGSFALDIDKQEGNTITESTSFQAPLALVSSPRYGLWHESASLLYCR